jgi:hypothetical protein
MVRNGAQAIHLATGLVVGYPPCPWTDYFREFIETRYHVQAVIGSHPIPQKYLAFHEGLPSLATLERGCAAESIMATEDVRRAYD